MDIVKEVFDVCFTHRKEGEEKLRSVVEDPFKYPLRNFVEELYFPLARLMIHYADLDFVEEVLFPLLPQDDKRYAALENMLLHMKAARGDRCVFPMNVDYKTRWDRPVLSPLEVDGKKMISWMPMAMTCTEPFLFDVCDRSVDGKEQYGQVELTDEQFEHLAVDCEIPEERDSDIHATNLKNRFFEMAFYGEPFSFTDNVITQIRQHKCKIWNDERLPPLRDDLVQEVEDRIMSHWKEA